MKVNRGQGIVMNLELGQRTASTVDEVELGLVGDQCING